MVTKKRENLQNKLFVNLFDKKKYRAIIFNSNGEQIAIINIKRDEKTFKWNGKTYKTDFEAKTYLKRSNLFNDFKYFLYQIDNPFPLEFKTFNKIDTKIKTDELNALLETKVLFDLNKLDNPLSKLFSTKGLIGLAIGGIILYIILSGGF